MHDRFITFEGGEGVGKTTLLNSLAIRLESDGHTVCRTREPGGTPVAEALRGVLLDPDRSDSDISPMTEALILAAARRNHVEQKIRPSLEAGHWVLCDRFIDSTRAYQGPRISSENLILIEDLATDAVRPHVTFLLDADPVDLIERRKARGETTDRFERRPMSYHHGVREAFLLLAKQFPERIQILNALNTPDELEKSAYEILKNHYADTLEANT